MKTRVVSNIDEIYFTSDLHLQHANIIELCDRPYSSLEEMNKALISNWNNTIKHGDWVYILGDFCWGDRKMWVYFLHQLPGNKILIQGNHDKDNNIPRDMFVDVIDGFLNMEIKDPDIQSKSQRLTLCHYPMLSWYQSHKGAWQLFGHWHTLATQKPQVNRVKEGESDYIREEFILMDRVRRSQWDVGVDLNNYTPISYQQIKKIMTKNLEISK